MSNLERAGNRSPERTLMDVLQGTALSFPEDPAVDDGHVVLTYGAHPEWLWSELSDALAADEHARRHHAHLSDAAPGPGGGRSRGSAIAVRGTVKPW